MCLCECLCAISDFRRLDRSPGKHVVVGSTAGERGHEGGRGGSLSKKEKFTQTHIHMFRTNIHELNRNLNRQ